MNRLFFTIVLVLSASLIGAQSRFSRDFDPIFSSLAPGSATLGDLQVEQLFALAVRKNWNAFDLLNEGILELQSRKIRISISGESLRKAAGIYRFGGSRVWAIIPIQKLKTMSLGLSFSKEAALEIQLTAPHNDFLELGDFYLDTVYGFSRIGPRGFFEAFGARVKSGPLFFDLDRIERVPDPHGTPNPHYIAIHVKMFFRPKQWFIEPVRLWAPGEIKQTS